jgi:hypothetical protein
MDCKMTDCRYYKQPVSNSCATCRRSWADNYIKAGFDLADFRIRVPAADGELYHLSMSGKTVTAQTLKFGIVKLFNALGIIPGGQIVEYDLINILKGYPDSYNKKLIISVLENKQTAEVGN